MTRQDKTCKSETCFESFLAQHRNRRECARKKTGQQARTATNSPTRHNSKCIKVHPLQLQQTQGLNL